MYEQGRIPHRSERSSFTHRSLSVAGTPLYFYEVDGST